MPTPIEVVSDDQLKIEELMRSNERLRDEYNELAKRALPSTLTQEVRDVLGMMIFNTGPIAHAFRAAGKDIPRKAEEEQAVVLFWLLGHALKHGTDWRKHAAAELPVT